MFFPRLTTIVVRYFFGKTTRSCHRPITVDTLIQELSCYVQYFAMRTCLKEIRDSLRLTSRNKTFISAIQSCISDLIYFSVLITSKTVIKNVSAIKYVLNIVAGNPLITHS